MRIIDPFELRANPQLAVELRSRPGEHAERRFARSTVELREKDDGGFRIVGLAAVFDDLSENLGGFREKIDPGAFESVLERGPDVRALINHDPNLVFARTVAGTLSLEEGKLGDRSGLVYDADPADVSYVRDLRVLLDRGDVDQSSFAFRVESDSWDEDEDGRLVRTIHEFRELYDVSPVTYPAYPTTSAGTRDHEGTEPAARLARIAAQLAGLEGKVSRQGQSFPDQRKRRDGWLDEMAQLLDGLRSQDSPPEGEQDDVPGSDAQAWRRAARQRRIRVRELEGQLGPRHRA